jgi:hypothetical protein
MNKDYDENFYLVTNLPSRPLLAISPYEVPKVGQIAQLFEYQKDPSKTFNVHIERYGHVFYRVLAIDLEAKTIELEDVDVSTLIMPFCDVPADRAHEPEARLGSLMSKARSSRRGGMDLVLKLADALRVAIKRCGYTPAREARGLAHIDQRVREQAEAGPSYWEMAR